MRDDASRLRDIVRGIDLIQQETQIQQVAFAQDPKLHVWVLYHLQVIGEPARSLSKKFLLRFPDPVWSKAVGPRNILVHHYFEIDQDLIWQVVEQDLPAFRETVIAALEQLEENRPRAKVAERFVWSLRGTLFASLSGSRIRCSSSPCDQAFLPARGRLSSTIC